MAKKSNKDGIESEMAALFSGPSTVSSNPDSVLDHPNYSIINDSIFEDITNITGLSQTFCLENMPAKTCFPTRCSG